MRRPSSGSPPFRGRRETGQAAEALVEQLLIDRGYEIVAKNVSFRNIGEIDIIAREGNVICFVEVRSRRDVLLGQPSETVGFTKQRKVRRLAQLYLDREGLDNPARFDVAAVVWQPSPSIHYIEDAFS